MLHNFHATDETNSHNSNDRSVNVVTCFHGADNPMIIHDYSGKLCHMLSSSLIINNHLWPFGKTFSHAFHDTDDPIPYMAIHENFVTRFP